jgi:hypothetical protein
MSRPSRISWIPSWLGTAQREQFELADERRPGASWSCERPAAAGWDAAGVGLRDAAARLRAMKAEEIIAAIGGVAERWCDRTWPVRRQTRDAVVAATGFSPQAVDHSFDLELRNYRADALHRTVQRELGDLCVLDRFHPEPTLAGATIAFGPAVTLAVLTGNVPGLPALPIVRALLVKSAVIAKVASGEPTFAAAFARSLHEADPRLGAALLVTYWRRDEHDLLERALDQAEAVIAYGSEAACAAVRRRVRPGQRYVEHGHKLSIGYLSRAFRAEVGDATAARLIAADTCAFNQQACIAPQAYFVEGTPAQVAQLGERLAGALHAHDATCPLGEVAAADQRALRYSHLCHAWQQAATGRTWIWRDPAMQWTAVVCDEVDFTSSHARFMRLVPVTSLADVERILSPHRGYLQNCAVGVTRAEFPGAARRLAELGASRLCDPGRMAEPSMMWRHDGMMCVAALLRWCDVEMHSSCP